MENENKTSLEDLINIKSGLANNINEKIRGIDLSKVVIIADTVFRTYNDGDFSVSAYVTNYVDSGSNSVEVTCYARNDYETNKGKVAFFINQLEAFFAYAKKLSNA